MTPLARLRAVARHCRCRTSGGPAADSPGQTRLPNRRVHPSTLPHAQLCPREHVRLTPRPIPAAGADGIAPALLRPTATATPPPEECMRTLPAVLIAAHCRADRLRVRSARPDAVCSPCAPCACYALCAVCAHQVARLALARRARSARARRGLADARGPGRLGQRGRDDRACAPVHEIGRAHV